MSDHLVKEYAAPSASASTAKDLDAIIEGLVALPANPYVAGAIFVVKGFGIVNDFIFQNRVLSELEEINKKLSEINSKVDEILTILHNLDVILKRALEEHEKENIRNYFWAVRTTSINILAKYVKGGGQANKKISDEDSRRLKDDAHEVARRSFELSRWGYDAHVGVAFGYSNYLFITRAVGGSYQDPAMTRLSIHQAIVEARDGLIEQRRIMMDSNAAVLASLQGLDATSRKLITEERGLSTNCAQLYGNWLDGFKIGYNEIYDYYVPDGYIWFYEASPLLSGIVRAEEVYVRGQIELIMNSAVVDLRGKLWTDQQLKDMDALVSSATAIAEAVLVA